MQGIKAAASGSSVVLVSVPLLPAAGADGVDRDATDTSNPTRMYGVANWGQVVILMVTT